ncbi:hypothetical protein O181_024736 [Austropuccinia psidii MF-1]|uniref:Tf2-1-like SH3-like domain-containing protein n=1 Tax=Austropuccinia psidii MF-1 TaxID=1389203 RepID=A0A9Q3GYW4_9BASI|nr:hypothetical protein [Austropuccinia psidii MF-1]
MSCKAPDFNKGDQVPISTLSFNSLKGPKGMIESYVGPFTIIRMIGENAVEVRLTEEFSRKHLVFLVILLKPYHKTDNSRYPSHMKVFTLEKVVEEEDSPTTVKKIIKPTRLRIHGEENK